MARSSFLVGSFLVITLMGCTRTGRDLRPLTLLAPTGQHLELQVEIADTPEERSRGLMFRTELPEGRGMLFIFEEQQVRSFWMKNTVIPLDILFFDAGGRLVSIATMEPCMEDPCLPYPSVGEAQYALEVPAGFVERHGIVEGWSGRW